MKRVARFGIGVLFLAAGALFLSAPASAGAPGPRQPAEFSLAATSGGSAYVSFVLALRTVEPTALPGIGTAVIEDPTWPYSTALGWQALYSNTYGTNNTATGYMALYSTTSGYSNTAVGSEALYSNTGGQMNTANGTRALYNNTSGIGNTGDGSWALHYNTEGWLNTALGMEALINNVAGQWNTAAGAKALYRNLGSKNTSLGFSAGFEATEGFYNIFLGADVVGQTDDTNTIRIGLPYDSTQSPPAGQNQTFIGGIVEKPFTASDTPAIVGITSEGQLGTMSSELLPQELISGSLLLLPAGMAPPPGYSYLGSTFFTLTLPNKKTTKLIVNVYQKQ